MFTADISLVNSLVGLLAAYTVAVRLLTDAACKNTYPSSDIDTLSAHSAGSRCRGGRTCRVYARGRAAAASLTSTVAYSAFHREIVCSLIAWRRQKVSAVRSVVVHTCS